VIDFVKKFVIGVYIAILCALAASIFSLCLGFLLGVGIASAVGSCGAPRWLAEDAFNLVFLAGGVPAAIITTIRLWRIDWRIGALPDEREFMEAMMMPGALWYYVCVLGLFAGIAVAIGCGALQVVLPVVGPEGLMIGGAVLVLAGIIGFAVSGKKEVESGTALPGDTSKPET
jgi:hypothetical protein